MAKTVGGVCERCWQAAVNETFHAGGDVVEAYRLILKLNDCTPEQQAGAGALRCDACGRKAVHPVTQNCRACGTVAPHWPSESEMGEVKNG